MTMQKKNTATPSEISSPSIKASAYQPESVQSQLPSGATISGSTPSTSDLLKSQVKAKSQQIIKDRTEQNFYNNPLFKPLKDDGTVNPNWEKNRQVFLEHTNQIKPTKPKEFSLVDTPIIPYVEGTSLNDIVDLGKGLITGAAQGVNEGLETINKAPQTIINTLGDQTGGVIDKSEGLAKAGLELGSGAVETGLSAGSLLHPELRSFVLASNAIKETANKNLPERQAIYVNNMVDIPMAAVTSVAEKMGFDAKEHPNWNMLMKLGDLYAMILMGKAYGKIKSGDIPTPIKSMKDLQELSKKAAENKLSPEEEVVFNQIGKEPLPTISEIKAEAETQDTPESKEIARKINEIEQFKLKSDVRDAELKKVQEDRVKLGHEPESVFGDIPKSVTATIERIHADKPTDPTQLSETSDYLYSEYKRLQALKSDNNRTFTTDQINEGMDQLGKAIEEMEQHKTYENEMSPELKELHKKQDDLDKAEVSEVLKPHIEQAKISVSDAINKQSELDTHNKVDKAEKVVNELQKAEDLKSAEADLEKNKSNPIVAEIAQQKIDELKPISPEPVVEKSPPTQEVKVESGDIEGEKPINEKGGIIGSSGETKFTSDKSVPFTFKLVESESLQPSHLPSGERNQEHTIARAQPKERNDANSKLAQDKIASEPNLNEVGDSPNAYFGAPIVNERGEVIQGNNRSIGLKKHYDNNGTKYKADLAENADKYGLTKEQVNNMKNPILVREVKVDDAKAIELGQHDVKDLETGGKQSIDPISTSRKMSPQDKSKLASLLFIDKPIKEAIREKISSVAEILKKYLNPAQIKNAFNADGSPTVKGMDGIKETVTHFLFDGGEAILPEVYDGLSDNIRKGIEKALPNILSLEAKQSLLPELQKAILALHEFNNASEHQFEQWANDVDIFSGKNPKEVFSPLELKLAKELGNAKNQTDIYKIFKQFENNIKGSEATLLDEKIDGISKKEAVKKQFNIDYDETTDKPEGYVEPQGKEGDNGNLQKEGEPNKPAQPIPANDAKIKAKQKLDDARKAFRVKFGNSLNSGGLSSVPEFVNVVKAAIEYGIVTAKDFIKLFREDFPESKITDEELIKGFDDLKSRKEAETTGVTHEQTNEAAKEFGLEEYEPNPETQKQWEAEADKIIESNPKAIPQLIKKLENGGEATPVDQKIMQRYLSSLNARLRENMSDDLIAEFKKAKNLSDIQLGRNVAKSLVARKGEIAVEDTLGGMLAEMQEASGVDTLTEAQKEAVKKSFTEIETAKATAEAKIKQLETELAKYKADKDFKNLIDETRRNKRKVTKEKLDSEFEDLSKAFQKATRGTLNANINAEAVVIIGKMVRNRVEKGVVNLQEVIDSIHDKVKDSNISKEDIRDVLAGKYNEKKQTINEINSQIRDLRDEAKYINKLEALQRGESPKTEAKKIARNKEIAELQQKIKDFKKESGISTETALRSAKTRNENTLKKLEEKIKNKDYETKKRVSPLDSELAKSKFPKLRNEVLDAIKTKDDAKHQWYIDKAKAEIAGYNKVQKAYEGAKKIITTLRAVKAGIDDSFTMIQGGLAMMANPQSGAKAFKEHVLDAASEKRFERELTALHNSENWELIKNSKLDIFEPKSIKEREREGVLDYNLLNETFKIKGKEFNVGKYTTRPFERAFISMGNNLRLNVFMRRAEQLFKEGKTFETHPQEFKDLAEVVNTMTGRGTLHTLADNKLVNSVVWSPRLLASGFNILGLGDVANPLTRGKKGYYAKLTPEMRKYAISQTVKGVGLGVGLMMAAKAGGSDVDTDPTSVTFGNVKFSSDGNAYNVFGRFTPIIRLIAMSAIGKKTYTDGTVKKTDAGKETLRFLRGKLTPLMGTATNVVTGKTYMGDEVTVAGEFHNMIDPLSLTDIIKGVKEEGSVSLLNRGIPAFEGIKVTNEKDFPQKSEADKKREKIIKDLTPKTAEDRRKEFMNKIKKH